jgi:hypothetical protein
MRKYVILVSVLVLVAAVAITLGVAGKGTAYPTGWSGGCANCHGAGATNPIFPHNVSAHPVPGTSCTNCHTGSVNNASTVDISKCATCHQGLTHIVNEPTHSTSGCLAAGCHGTTTTTGATSTTTGATTTTTGGNTTTTSGGTTTTRATTTTTAHVTTTTAHATTTTTAAATTTTIPVEEPSFTG